MKNTSWNRHFVSYKKSYSDGWIEVGMAYPTKCFHKHQHDEAHRQRNADRSSRYAANRQRNHALHWYQNESSQELREHIAPEDGRLQLLFHVTGTEHRGGTVFRIFAENIKQQQNIITVMSYER